MRLGPARARLAGLVALLTSAWTTGVVHARANAELSEVVAHLEARGAGRIEEIARRFLFAGQSSATALVQERAGCIGYLAIGRGEVRDLDLALYTRSGQLLAEDAASAPYAYARVCGAAGLALYASASLYAGRGELVLLRIEDAPRELGRLPESLGLAVSAGGALEELRAVGSAADELSVEGALAQEERTFEALGYGAAGGQSALELRAGSARGFLMLRAGSCFRISVFVPHARGVALEVEAPTAERWSARSGGEERVAIALCTQNGGLHAVRVQARALRGVALLRAFERSDVPAARVRELGAGTALAVAEAESLARARGLSLSPIGEAWVEASAPLSWPVALPARGCYALAAIVAVGAPPVDIRLTSERGILLAHNEGRRGLPMVFFCVAEAGNVRVLLRPRGPDLRVGIWLGRTPGGDQ